MENYLGEVEILRPSCNISTVLDGRGGIFNWVPPDPILEFALLFFHPNRVRGNHFHPEFTEYFLIVKGSVLFVTQDRHLGIQQSMLASTGTCFRTPPGVPHAVHAIEDAICISFLTKPWDKCEVPIVRTNLVPFDQGYLNYSSSIDE